MGGMDCSILGTGQMEVQQASLFTIVEIMTTLASQDAESYNDLGRGSLCYALCKYLHFIAHSLHKNLRLVLVTSTVQMKKPRLCEGCLATKQPEARH